MKLSVIIPVFNESSTIEELLRRVEAVEIEKEIIVVDDASYDGTKEILKKKDAPNIKVIYHPKNLGKGAAIRTGLKHITGDVVIIQDADLELDPRDYIRLLEPIKSGQTDIVLGSRFLEIRNNLYLPTFLANKIFTSLINILYHTKLTDISTCYKMFKTSLIQKISPLKSNRFNIDSEIVAKVCKRGYKIQEIPITYNPRRYIHGKKIKWWDSFLIIWTILKYKFID
jgi:glycosyltransferase involved in cell wall biosynthesis